SLPPISSGGAPTANRDVSLSVLLTFILSHRLVDPSGSLQRTLAQERTRALLRKHAAFEQVDRHELLALPPLLRHARIPVLDLYEHTLAVVKIKNWNSCVP